MKKEPHNNEASPKGRATRKPRAAECGGVRYPRARRHEKHQVSRGDPSAERGAGRRLHSADARAPPSDTISPRDGRTVVFATISKHGNSPTRRGTQTRPVVPLGSTERICVPSHADAKETKRRTRQARPVALRRTDGTKPEPSGLPDDRDAW